MIHTATGEGVLEVGKLTRTERFEWISLLIAYTADYNGAEMTWRDYEIVARRQAYCWGAGRD